MTLSAELKQQVEQDITGTMEKVVESQVLQALEEVKKKGNINDAELRALYLQGRPKGGESLHSLVSKGGMEEANIGDIIAKVTTEKNKLIAYVKENSLTDLQKPNFISELLFRIAGIDRKDISKNSPIQNVMKGVIDEFMSLFDTISLIGEDPLAFFNGLKQAFANPKQIIDAIIAEYNPDMSTPEGQVAAGKLGILIVTSLIPGGVGAKISQALGRIGKYAGKIASKTKIGKIVVDGAQKAGTVIDTVQEGLKTTVGQAMKKTTEFIGKKTDDLILIGKKTDDLILRANKLMNPQLARNYKKILQEIDIMIAKKAKGLVYKRDDTMIKRLERIKKYQNLMQELSMIENALKAGKNIITDPLRKGIIVAGKLIPISGPLQTALFEGMHQEIINTLEEAGPEEELTENREDIKIGSDIIQFEKGETEITEAMKTVINQKMQGFVDELQRRQTANPPEDTTDMTIVLTGFASWDGGNKAINEALAKKRADTMKTYLQTTFPVLTDQFFTSIRGIRQETPVVGKTAKEYQSVYIEASWNKKAQVTDQDHKDRREKYIGKGGLHEKK